ncbi:hypothetical protein LV157_005960 [Aspergillus fumigatus]|nr:hypothetical protein LV157_005960 [Aspergillus fumigatus]
MNSREHSDMPPATSYPSPNAAQMAQGSMPYYGNRQLTADELLSAELSRETSGPGLNDGSSNGVHHGQSMVMGSSNPGATDMGRPSSPDQHQQHMLQFTPGQQVGVDPNHDLSYGDQSARRKRSKISRACDECEDEEQEELKERVERLEEEQNHSSSSSDHERAHSPDVDDW